METTRPTVQVLPRTQTKPRTIPPRQWHVVLLDDDDHTYEYVIRLAQEIFAYPPERGYQIARAVDGEGRAILCTTHRELAELRLEQVHGFGADPLSKNSAGSMSAMLEPADFGPDDESNG